MIRKLTRTADILVLLGTLFSIARLFAAHWTNGLIRYAMIKHIVGSAAAVTPIGRPTYVVARTMIPVVQKAGDAFLAAFPRGGCCNRVSRSVFLPHSPTSLRRSAKRCATTTIP